MPRMIFWKGGGEKPKVGRRFTRAADGDKALQFGAGNSWFGTERAPGASIFHAVGRHSWTDAECYRYPQESLEPPDGPFRPNTSPNSPKAVPISNAMPRASMALRSIRPSTG